MPCAPPPPPMCPSVPPPPPPGKSGVPIRLSDFIDQKGKSDTEARGSSTQRADDSNACLYEQECQYPAFAVSAEHHAQVPPPPPMQAEFAHRSEAMTQMAAAESQWMESAYFAQANMEAWAAMDSHAWAPDTGMMSSMPLPPPPPAPSQQSSHPAPHQSWADCGYPAEYSYPAPAPPPPVPVAREGAPAQASRAIMCLSDLISAPSNGSEATQAGTESKEMATAERPRANRPGKMGPRGMAGQ
jgi:hypothetical protein